MFLEYSSTNPSGIIFGFLNSIKYFSVKTCKNVAEETSEQFSPKVRQEISSGILFANCFRFSCTNFLDDFRYFLVFWMRFLWLGFVVLILAVYKYSSDNWQYFWNHHSVFPGSPSWIRPGLTPVITATIFQRNMSPDTSQRFHYIFLRTFLSSLKKHHKEFLKKILQEF